MNIAQKKDGSAETPLRANIRDHYWKDEAEVIRILSERIGLSEPDRKKVADMGAQYVTRVRKETDPSMMEAFLAEYGLSTEEGVGLMCLAEALLRVPDAETIDDLIEDKIAPVELGRASGQVVVVDGQCLDLGADADRARAGR